jgi:hypothetical protein
VSTEPDTRPFTSAELAQFLEQLELDRQPPRASVHERGPLRVVASEPATTLGLGELVSFAAPGRPVSELAALASWPPPIAAPRASCAVAAPAPRTIPDPFLWTYPAAGSRIVRLRLGLVLAALLLSGWLACLVSAPSRAPRAHAAHRSPPPLPVPAARTPDPSELSVDAARAPDPHVRAAASGPSPADPVVAAALREVVPGPEAAPADADQAARGERVDAPEARLDATRVLGDAQQELDSPPLARREAVDLLLSGRTGAALAAYRALPAALLAQPALIAVVRQLERELRECSRQGGTPCGS